jgi:hypothetical protein
MRSDDSFRLLNEIEAAVALAVFLFGCLLVLHLA